MFLFKSYIGTLLMGPPPRGQRFHLEVFRSLVGVVQAPFPGLLGDITEAGPAGVFWWERRYS